MDKPRTEDGTAQTVWDFTADQEREIRAMISSGRGDEARTLTAFRLAARWFAGNFAARDDARLQREKMEREIKQLEPVLESAIKQIEGLSKELLAKLVALGGGISSEELLNQPSDLLMRVECVRRDLEEETRPDGPKRHTVERHFSWRMARAWSEHMGRKVTRSAGRSGEAGAFLRVLEYVGKIVDPHFNGTTWAKELSQERPVTYGFNSPHSGG